MRPTDHPTLHHRARTWRRIATPAAVVFFVLTWRLVAWLGDYPAFILPTPERVATRLWQVLADGSLFTHMGRTLSELLLGLALGLSTATLAGYLLAKSRLLERLLAPYIVASQAVPIIAIAPLIFIWFGPGLLSNVLLTALIVFFPILINTIVGLRSVPPELADLMRSYQATRWQTFHTLELPAALPVLLGGLKIGATLAVIGATVGEFVRPSAGLGYLILTAKNRFDTELVFVALISLAAMALTIYGLVSVAEQQLLSWQKETT
jgi:NitT/TauT family transport system permease protein